MEEHNPFKPWVGGDGLSNLCGNQSLDVWDPTTGAMGQCFFSLALTSPIHALLGVASAYYLGAVAAIQGARFRIAIRTALYVRTATVFVLLLTAFIPYMLYLAYHANPWALGGWSLVIETVTGTLAWLLHMAYVITLLSRLSFPVSGHRVLLLLVSICALLDVLQFREAARERVPRTPESDIPFISGFVKIAAFVSYAITLLITCSNSHLEVDPESDRDPLMNDQNEDELIHGGREGYLGVAKEEANFFSQFFFYWVGPLIKRGQTAHLNEPSDLFNLPIDMTAPIVSQRFQLQLNTHRPMGPRTRPPGWQMPLLKILWNSFGLKFLSVGALKLFADIVGFMSPMLLHGLVSFMEDGKEEAYWGYLYAAGLATTTFLVAIANTHFNLQIGELGLKIRAAVLTAVYQHTLAVSPVDLQSKFSVGQVINFMSTDTDRVVNFFPSLHSAWSLPFQFVVTMYLLYRQVGLASLAGVVLTVIMIPINKLIADWIGKLSTKMMAAKDARVKVMSEILTGMRVIKFQTWEDFFSGKVNEHRDEELTQLKWRKYLDALCVYLWATTPVLISVMTFSLYVLLGHQLTAAKVFTSVALFAMLTGPLNAFPWVINGLVEAMVSIRRLAEFLSLPVLDRDQYFSSMSEAVSALDDEDGDLAVAIGKGKFAVSSKESEQNIFKLRNISLQIRKGDFLGVVGKVGSGKSTLLSALLGELKREGGAISVRVPPGGIAYVQQEPWLQQGSIRDNILFGRHLNQERYEKVLDACALNEDLALMAAGDATQVGEAGVMLSGGQKARLALARAVYADKEAYVIDDVFSAVDVAVGMHIYRKCIMGLLRKKTRIMCTHHPKFLSAADKVIVLENGEIVDEGSPKTVLSKVDFSQMETKPKTEEDTDEKTKDNIEVKDSLTDEETRETGHVKFDIYKQYWKAVGNFLSPAILIALGLMQASKNFTDVWLAEWVSHDENDPNRTHAHFYELINVMAADKGRNNSVSFYLTVYASIAVINTVFSLIRAFLFAWGGICAARIIHKRLLNVIMAAKIRFFDSTPAGRILNRFSSDLYTVDDSLPFILNIFLDQLFGVFGPLIVCAYAVPWIMLILVPLAFIYYDVQRRYRPASRDLKRLGSVSLSPIYSHFSETLNGLSTIRAMEANWRFAGENEERLEANQRAQYAAIAAAQWLELRLQLIGCGVVSGIALIAAMQHHVDSVDPGYIGLAISYALGVTGKLSGLVKSFTETEKELVAVERCVQYIEEISTEDHTEGRQRPEGWPREGAVELNAISMRYREGLPKALDDVTIKIEPAEKVGIVGRTGSGKSSLFQVLFRLNNAQSGEIKIDNLDISTLQLRDLRRSLAIIPQDPFLFSGTLRENLDPLGSRPDEALLESLRRCHLLEKVVSMGGLEAKVAERGRSLSVGQRQLFCLARAILSSAKIVCVDEATANVDLETDKLVQKVLLESLKDRTVISIAHRIETVEDLDRVIIMSQCRAIDGGSPKNLLKDRNLSDYDPGN